MFDILGGFVCKQPEEDQCLGAAQVSQQFDQLRLLITLFNLVVIVVTLDDVLLYFCIYVFVFSVFAVVVLVISRLGGHKNIYHQCHFRLNENKDISIAVEKFLRT